MYYILLPIGYSVQWRVCWQGVQCPPYALYAFAANGDRLQQLAAVGDIAGCGGHFACFYCTFRVNPHFDLEPDYITRKPIVHRIQRYILRRKYCQLFTHESIIDQ